MGGQDVGILHVRTGDDDDDGFIGEDFTVARVKRRLLQQSYIGAIYTRRDARGRRRSTPATRSASTSAWPPRSFLGSQNLEATGWFLHATRPGVSSGNTAFGAAGRLSERPVERARRRARGAGEFRSRRSASSPAATTAAISPSLAFGPRPRNHRYIRQFLFGANLDVQTDLDNDAAASEPLGLTVLDVQLHSQDSFAFGTSSDARAARRAVRHQPGHHAAARRRVRLHALLRCAARRPTGACSPSTRATRRATSIRAPARRRSPTSPSAPAPATSST